MSFQANKNRAPIIFLTAFGNKIEHQLMGYELGAVDYLTKPFNPDILLRKVTVFQELYISRQNTVNLKRYYKETLDHAFEGIIRTDLKGHIHYINERGSYAVGCFSRGGHR